MSTRKCSSDKCKGTSVYYRASSCCKRALLRQVPSTSPVHLGAVHYLFTSTFVTGVTCYLTHWQLKCFMSDVTVTAIFPGIYWHACQPLFSQRELLYMKNRCQHFWVRVSEAASHSHSCDSRSCVFGCMAHTHTQLLLSGTNPSGREELELDCFAPWQCCELAVMFSTWLRLAPPSASAAEHSSLLVLLCLSSCQGMKSRQNVLSVTVHYWPIASLLALCKHHGAVCQNKSVQDLFCVPQSVACIYQEVLHLSV